MYSLRFDQCLKVFDKLANKSSPFMMSRTQQYNGTHLTVSVFTSYYNQAKINLASYAPPLNPLSSVPSFSPYLLLQRTFSSSLPSPSQPSSA